MCIPPLNFSDALESSMAPQTAYLLDDESILELELMQDDELTAPFFDESLPFSFSLEDCAFDDLDLGLGSTLLDIEDHDSSLPLSLPLTLSLPEPLTACPIRHVSPDSSSSAFVYDASAAAAAAPSQQSARRAPKKHSMAKPKPTKPSKPAGVSKPSKPRAALRLKKVNSRITWTATLHRIFVQVVESLGGADKATPTLILENMSVRGLRVHHIKSHLQKHRRCLSEGIDSTPVDSDADADLSDNESRDADADTAAEL